MQGFWIAVAIISSILFVSLLILFSGNKTTYKKLKYINDLEEKLEAPNPPSVLPILIKPKPPPMHGWDDHTMESCRDKKWLSDLSVKYKVSYTTIDGYESPKSDSTSEITSHFSDTCAPILTFDSSIPIDATINIFRSFYSNCQSCARWGTIYEWSIYQKIAESINPLSTWADHVPIS